MYFADKVLPPHMPPAAYSQLATSQELLDKSTLPQASIHSTTEIAVCHTTSVHVKSGQPSIHSVSSTVSVLLVSPSQEGVEGSLESSQAALGVEQGGIQWCNNKIK